MTTSISTLIQDVRSLRFNPAAIQRRALETLLEVSGDSLDVVDPSNPFVFLMESSAINASATMVNAEALTRQQYPSMALTEDELYLHMSDRDYLGRFANPAKCIFTLLFNKDELITKAIPTEIGGVKKLVVPRNTEFFIGEYTFTMEYPIELRVMSHGGLQVVYDVSRVSPIVNIESNVLDWGVVRIENTEFLRVRVPVLQMKVKSYKAALSLSTVYSKTFSLTDSFYYCRAYAYQSDGSIYEIKTTHTDQVYDPTKPTVVLKLYSTELNVTIPQIYLTNGLLQGEVRIDLYTTKGPINLTMSGYEINAFSANWRDLDYIESVGAYGTPITVFSSMAVYSEDNVSGGTLALSFDELRERVLNNALGNSQLPITNAQVSSFLSNRGYRSIVNVDNITNRIFLASKILPKPINGLTVAGASCTVASLQDSFYKLSSLRGVIDNNKRITLTSDTLYYLDNGVLKVVPNETRTLLETLTPEQLVSNVNTGTYLYSPFHNVLDYSTDYFESRRYYLDDPKVTDREFVEENTFLGLQVNLGGVALRRETDRYVLQIVTKAGDTLKTLGDTQLLAQLSFKPDGEQNLVYLNSRFVGRLPTQEWVLEFDLLTNFDIDSKNNIDFTNFVMFVGETRNFRSSILESFNLVFFAKDYYSNVATLEDLTITHGVFLLEGDYKPINHQRLTLELGYYLEDFWNRSRAVLGERDYQRYSETVYAYYTENVYERDPVTGMVVLIEDAEGNIGFNLLHASGDPVLDSEGEHVVRFYTGDIVLDAEGNPTLLEERYLLVESDLFLVDAKYRFATSTADTVYLKEIPQTIITWLKNDISEFKRVALEQTKLYLYPQRTIGKTKANILDGIVRDIELEQSFKVTFYLNNAGYINENLRNSLKGLALQVIEEALKGTRVTISQIVSKLTAMVGEDVISVTVEGLGGSLNLPTVTILDETDKLAIKKRLVIELDNTRSVQDDVDVVFIRHEV